MTAAELKTLREACGLSQDWLAKRADVNQRTVRYWESGKSPVPEDVAQVIASIDEMLDAAAEQAREQARRLTLKNGKPEAVTLFRYSSDDELWTHRKDMQGLPATCHAALLARARRLLMVDGQAVEIHWG